MKKVKHRRVSYFTSNKEDNLLIKEFMEDDRKDVDYLGWTELIGVMEVIADTLPVKFEMTNRDWCIRHQYQTFYETYMWHHDRTRQMSLYVVIVDFLRWWERKDRHVIDAHYKWLKEQKKS